MCNPYIRKQLISSGFYITAISFAALGSVNKVKSNNLSVGVEMSKHVILKVGIGQKSSRNYIQNETSKFCAER